MAQVKGIYTSGSEIRKKRKKDEEDNRNRNGTRDATAKHMQVKKTPSVSTPSRSEHEQRIERIATRETPMQNKPQKQVSRPVTDEEFDRIWYEDDPRYQRAQKLKYLQREKTPEEAAFDLLWYEDDPDYTRVHLDADSARAEQRAAREYLANRSAAEYTENKENDETKEDERNLWDRIREGFQELYEQNSHSVYDDLLAARSQRDAEEERREMAADSSTQAAMDEKLAIRRRNEEQKNSVWGQNSQIEEKAREYSDGPAAFDSEGHINGQGHPSIGGMRFGNSDVKTSGCGAIAVYNVLQDLGNTRMTLSDIIQTAEKSGCMLAGGLLGMTAGQLSRLMDECGIDHHEVDPRELDQRARNGEIANGTKYVVTVANSSFPEILQDFEDYYQAAKDIPDINKMNWSLLGHHNFEAVFDDSQEDPWIVYNVSTTKYVRREYSSLVDVAGHKLSQFIAIYEVDE